MGCPQFPPEDIMNALAGDLLYEDAMKWMLRSFLQSKNSQGCTNWTKASDGSQVSCREQKNGLRAYCDCCRAAHMLEMLKEQKRI